MSKVYQYRKHIRWGQYVIAVIFPIIVVACVFGGLVLSQQPRAQDDLPSLFKIAMLVISACGTIIFTAEGFFLWYLYYRLAGVRVILEDDSITYKHRSGETRIDINKITEIGLPSIPYLGGWITVAAGKEKIRLTVVVSEIGDFVRSLKTSLDKIGLADRYNEAKLFLFLKTAVFSDQSWDRIYSLFWKLVAATIGIGGIGIATALISNKGGFPWALLSLIFPTLVYLFTEIVFVARFAKVSVRESFFVPPRDVDYENSVYKVSMVVGMIIYLTIALVIMFVLRL